MLYLSYQFLLLIFSTIKELKRFKLIYVILFVCYFGLSYPSGNDFVGYFSNYDCLINKNCPVQQTTFEPGYTAFVKIFGVAGYQSLIFIVAIFNAILIYKFSKNFKEKSIVFVLLTSVLGWVLYTEAIRQAMALSITLVAIPNLHQRKIIKFVFWTLVASLFHSTALLTLIFATGLLNKKIKYTVFATSFIPTILVLIFPEQIINLLSNVNLTALSINSKIIFYLSSEMYRPQVAIGLGAIPDLGLLCSVGYLYLKTYKYNDLSWITPGLLLFIIFTLLLGRLMPVLTRIGWYGLPYLAIIVSISFNGSTFVRPVNFKYKTLTKTLIIMWIFAQIFRPFSYSHSEFNIMKQSTIFSRLNLLDDNSLTQAAIQQCSDLRRLGYEDLCYVDL